MWARKKIICVGVVLLLLLTAHCRHRSKVRRAKAVSAGFQARAEARHAGRLPGAPPTQAEYMRDCCVHEVGTEKLSWEDYRKLRAKAAKR